MSKWILSVLSIGALLINAVSAEPATPRTPSYDGVMQFNFARDFSTDRYLQFPNLIDDQFVEGSYYPVGTGTPTANAALSFKAADFNWFGGWIPQSATSSLIKVGLAKSQVFGAGLLIDFDKIEGSIDNGTKLTGSQYMCPDGIGAFGSFGFGANNIYANLSSNAMLPSSSDLNTSPTTETITTHQLTAFNAGWGMFGSGERSSSIGADFSFAFGQHTVVAKTTGAADVKDPDSSGMTIGVVGHYGTPLVLKDKDYEVLAGADAGITFLSSATKHPVEAEFDTADFIVRIRPNISFQKYLGNGFDAELGGAVNLVTWDMGSSKLAGAGGAPDTKVAVNTFRTDGASVNLGLRWTKDNFALEGEVNPLLLINGPYFISGAGNATFASVGLVLAY